jgi:hypothetical protein
MNTKQRQQPHDHDRDRRPACRQPDVCGGGGGMPGRIRARPPSQSTSRAGLPEASGGNLERRLALARPCRRSASNSAAARQRGNSWTPETSGFVSVRRRMRQVENDERNEMMSRARPSLNDHFA